jgi:hypothetical protein
MVFEMVSINEVVVYFDSNIKFILLNGLVLTPHCAQRLNAYFLEYMTIEANMSFNECQSKSVQNR